MIATPLIKLWYDVDDADTKMSSYFPSYYCIIWIKSARLETVEWYGQRWLFEYGVMWTMHADADDVKILFKSNQLGWKP